MLEENSMLNESEPLPKVDSHELNDKNKLWVQMKESEILSNIYCIMYTGKGQRCTRI